MELGVIVKNLIIIGVILGAVFLSQQPDVKNTAKNIYANNKGITPYFVKAEDWVKKDFWPKVGGGASAIRTFASTEFTKQKNYFAQNVWDRLQNYLRPKISEVFGTEVK